MCYAPRTSSVLVLDGFTLSPSVKSKHACAMLTFTWTLFESYTPVPSLTQSTCCPLRPVVIHHLWWLPERPRGRDQSLPGGTTDEGAAEERAASSRRQSGGSQ